MGTYVTRAMESGKPEISPIGRYPFQAVGLDLSTAVNPPHGTGAMSAVAIISIPLDIVVDAVLLLPDLIAWPFGKRKYLSP